MSDASDLVLWDATEVARRLGVSRATVYRKVEAGKLPYVRVFGTVLRFEPDAILKLCRADNSNGDK
jgi:excisionase family DNA binding protein